jgi:hypothetical protein
MTKPTKKSPKNATKTLKSTVGSTQKSTRELPPVLHLKVKSPRNSYCSTANLRDLLWSEWWSDNSFGKFYLHVPHKDGETVHRVYCRKSTLPRIGIHRGELRWYVDTDGKTVKNPPEPKNLNKGTPYLVKIGKKHGNEIRKETKP